MDIVEIDERIIFGISIRTTIVKLHSDMNLSIRKIQGAII